MNHKLVVIGYLSQKICFLDMDKNKAIERYCEIEDVDSLKSGVDVDVFEFDNHFKAYEAWSSQHDG